MKDQTTRHSFPVCSSSFPSFSLEKNNKKKEDWQPGEGYSVQPIVRNILTRKHELLDTQNTFFVHPLFFEQFQYLLLLLLLLLLPLLHVHLSSLLNVLAQLNC